MGDTSSTPSPAHHSTTISDLVATSLNSRAPEGSPRPFPVLVAGKQLQLSHLLTAVSHLGGYSSATAAAKWPLIAADLGLEPRFAPTLKLVYLKYLKCLERSGGAATPTTTTTTTATSQETERRKSKRPRPDPSGMELLQWLRSMALEPGGAANPSKREKLLPVIKVLRKPESTETRSRSRSKYSLRQYSAGAPPHSPEAQPNPSTKEVPIGDEFQAKVPAFPNPDEAGEQDSKRFLGTLILARKTEEQAEEDQKLLERSRSRAPCTCGEKGSIECVRVHVESEQKWLKLFLGEPFSQWGFDRMGERVAKSWSTDEQNKFRRIFIRSGAGKDIWTELKLAFPQKPRKELVSFYFNVFLLRKRALQNRLGKKPDSDDDEEDPGYAPVSTPAPGGASFGFHAVHLVELD